MAHPIWITPKGSIGNIAEADYFEFALDAYSATTGTLTFSVISGELPTGIQLLPSGVLKGVPIVTLANDIELAYVSKFTIRVRNAANDIADRTFLITVNGIVPPQIVPAALDLGVYYDGNYLDTQLVAIDPNPEAVFDWRVTSGALPPGITLTIDGRLVGFLGEYIEPGTENVGWGLPNWDDINWDAAPQAQTQIYNFTARVFDGNAYAQADYSITVLSKSLMTVDLDYITVDVDYITVDIDNRHLPILTTMPQSMPDWRQNSQFAFKFTGMDLEGDHISYAVDSGTLPTGLSLDAESGWLTGKLASQIEDEKIYSFQIVCYKTDYLDINHVPIYVSVPVAFTMHVLGDISNRISWISLPLLGTIDNGSVSEFQVRAATPSNQQLNYELRPDFAGRLPRGLTLLSNGLITGRVSFRHFTLDGGATTIDDLQSTFDLDSRFVVVARNRDNTLYSEQEFTIRVLVTNERPYENIYLKALMARDQRETFSSVVQNTDIFPNELIYRSGDLFFGKATEVRFLFVAGLAPSSALEYFNAIEHNHYTKKIVLGDVKTAVALDENFNVKYEVVYIDVPDDLENNGKTPAAMTDLTDKMANPYTYGNNEYTVIRPNDFNNMTTSVTQNIGFSRKGVLPDWMLDKQPNGKVLGFTRAVVLAYTVPGASKLIAYRLKFNGIEFNGLDFTADRYTLDNYLTTHYDLVTDSFNQTDITTFDIDLGLVPQTEFDNGQTLFSGDIDKYAAPGENDKYIHYRQHGVFH